MGELLWHIVAINGLSGINVVLLLWVLRRISQVEDHVQYMRGYLKGISEVTNRVHKQV